MVLYGMLGGLVARTLRRAHALPLPKSVLLAILITSAYGVADELHQRFVPPRTCDVWDWVADTVGGAIAVGVYYTYDTRKSPKTNR